MKTIALLSTTILLSACNFSLSSGTDQEKRNKYRQADEQILCNPVDGRSFYIESHVSFTSFVLRTPHLDYVCKKQGN